MKAFVVSVGLLFGFASAALAVLDWGYATGELCVSNQGKGLGDVVGGFYTNYLPSPNGAEMKQWTANGSALSGTHSTRDIVSGVTRSGQQCLRITPLKTDGSLIHLRTPTLSAPAGETGARTTSESGGAYRPVVSSNYIFTFWVRTVATNGAHAKSAAASSLRLCADEGAGSRIGSPFWLIDGGGASGLGEFRMSFNDSFYLFNPYNYGYNTDPNPNPTPFPTSTDPDGRGGGALKRVRSYESCTLVSPSLDYARWYKVECRIAFADGMNNNSLFTGVSYSTLADRQDFASGSAQGLTQSNLFDAVCTLARLPNDRMTITCWDDTGAQVFQWGSSTVLTNDPCLVARTNTYTGLFTQESRGFGPGGANCMGLSWQTVSTNGLGFYLDDVSLSSANGAYSYATSFERLPPPPGTVIVLR